MHVATIPFYSYFLRYTGGGWGVVGDALRLWGWGNTALILGKTHTPASSASNIFPMRRRVVAIDGALCLFYYLKVFS
jgi:hypothetical protein